MGALLKAAGGRLTRGAAALRAGRRPLRQKMLRSSSKATI